MQIEKKIATHLTKCYSLAKLPGQERYLVASEKSFPCLVLDREGEVLETVWSEPGGVMTLEPLADGSFLATHRFYSPNDSAQASIVRAHREETGWQVDTLCPLPFVHRFGVLERDGKRYIAAATLKSDHAFRNDWTCPGRVWVGELPDDINESTQLKLEPLISGLTRNHGFFKLRKNGYTSCLVAAENGVYKVVPPEQGGQWTYTQLLDTPASDIAMADFDADGVDELLVLSPFHGDRLTIYHQTDSGYKPVYFFDHPIPFLHAIDVCDFNGRKAAVIGHREGARDLILIFHDGSGYRYKVIDHDVGPANVLCEPEGDGMRILSANREIDEVAIYHVHP